MIRRTPWVLVLAMLLAACSVAPPTPDASPDPSASGLAQVPTPPGSPAPEPCPVIPSTRPTAVPLPADLDEDTRVAIEMRADYGLRFDLVWVRQVAANPRAVMDFSIPMLPEETQTLFARNALPDPVLIVLAGYGHGDQFGGIYLDNALGGVVVVLWTADVAAHEAAIRPRLPDCHPVLFRQVRWSEAELREWQDRIFRDSDWFATIPAAARGFGARVSENVVTVEISSANPNAAAIIVAHYDAPAGMIRVESDGTGEALLPWGTVKGRVVTRDGKAPGENQLSVAQGPGGAPGACGAGDIGFGVLPNGNFEYRCQVGPRIIEIQDLPAPAPALGRGLVVVPANGVVFVQIVIDWPPQP